MELDNAKQNFIALKSIERFIDKNKIKARFKTSGICDNTISITTEGYANNPDPEYATFTKLNRLITEYILFNINTIAHDALVEAKTCLKATLQQTKKNESEWEAFIAKL